jgi:hypothetical protein
MMMYLLFNLSWRWLPHTSVPYTVAVALEIQAQEYEL